MTRYCTLDIEVENVPRQRDRVKRLKEMRLGWGCISEPETGRILHFQFESLSEALERLAGRMVVGWNILAHDLPILSLHSGSDLPINGVCDLCYEVKQKCGLWLKLDEVVLHTLGVSRCFPYSVPEMIRRRRWDLVASRCEHDVRDCENLFAFVQRYGYILYEEGKIGVSVQGGVPAWEAPPEQKPTPRQVRALRDLGRKVPTTRHEAQRLLIQTQEFWARQHARGV